MSIQASEPKCRNTSNAQRRANEILLSSPPQEVKINSSFLLQHSRSWISEDDIYKPHPEEVSDHDEAPPPAPAPTELQVSQSPPSVVHRRQIGESIIREKKV